MKLKHAKPPLALVEKCVTLHNDLVVASQGLKTLAEHRIVKACAANIDSVRLENNRYKFKLTAREYAETFGLDIDTAYAQLKTGCADLAERWIEWSETVVKERGIVARHKDRWVSGATYVDKAGWIELRFTPEATPFLTVLRGNHTTYVLRQAASLRSVYSWRLLEMLMQYKDTGWRHIPIADFLHAMDATASHRANFKDARKQIIEVAVKELQDKDGWKIDWEPVKEGRKVVALKFKFRRDPQGRLELEGAAA